MRQELDVGPFERPVSLDRGAEESPHTGIAAMPDGVLRAEGGRSLPPVDRNQSAADVYRDDELIPEFACIACERSVFCEGRRPDDDASRTRIQQLFRVCERTNPASGLDPSRARRCDDPSYELRSGPAGAGGAQVDEVNEFGAACDQPLDERERVALPVRDPPEVAALETNPLVAENVDRGNDVEVVWLC